MGIDQASTRLTDTPRTDAICIRDHIDDRSSCGIDERTSRQKHVIIGENIDLPTIGNHTSANTEVGCI
ncbi:hypothetical protein Enr10x_14200 [Gimesia panareensis]|uniref:Uncharacterized protein n=1 Tax=Gimesia panareensis TaxID=2527978 RepID=A0A517Q3D8_9PLAN|nr:hypothetical protein Enr10x_14200 [Gimesia panareensis]